MCNGTQLNSEENFRVLRGKFIRNSSDGAHLTTRGGKLTGGRHATYGYFQLAARRLRNSSIPQELLECRLFLL